MTTLTPEETAQLMPGYEKYLSNWREGYGQPLTFDAWWRAMADNIREGK